MLVIRTSYDHGIFQQPLTIPYIPHPRRFFTSSPPAEEIWSNCLIPLQQDQFLSSPRDLDLMRNDLKLQQKNMRPRSARYSPYLTSPMPDEVQRRKVENPILERLLKLDNSKTVYKTSYCDKSGCGSGVCFQSDGTLLPNTPAIISPHITALLTRVMFTTGRFVKNVIKLHNISPMNQQHLIRNSWSNLMLINIAREILHSKNDSGLSNQEFNIESILKILNSTISCDCKEAVLATRNFLNRCAKLHISEIEFECLGRAVFFNSDDLSMPKEADPSSGQQQASDVTHVKHYLNLAKRNETLVKINQLLVDLGAIKHTMLKDKEDCSLVWCFLEWVSQLSFHRIHRNSRAPVVNKFRFLSDSGHADPQQRQMRVADLFLCLYTLRGVRSKTVVAQLMQPLVGMANDIESFLTYSFLTN